MTAEDLDAEFDNIQQNSVAAEIEGYSTINNVDNDERMDSQVAPYPSEVRSYASSVAGEIERLRYMLAAITGNTEWYQTPAATIAQIAADLDSLNLSPANTVISGTTNAGGGASCLIPSGPGNFKVALDVSTPLVVMIDGTKYTFTSAATVSGLSAAPSSNNTALSNANYGPTIGENYTSIGVGSVGSNISSLGNNFAAFKHVNGATEFFLAQYDGPDSSIRFARRGYFIDSSGVPSDRVSIAVGEVITLLKLTYVFINTGGGLQITYNQPVTSGTAPSVASIGDYWYDSENQNWKIFDGGTWNKANATLLGVCAQDPLGCVAARTHEFFSIYNPLNTLITEYFSGSNQVTGTQFGQKISVCGKTISYSDSVITWDISGPGDFYSYVDASGNSTLSTIAPYDRQEDLFGFYHPYYSLRAVASLSYDGVNITAYKEYQKTGADEIGLNMTSRGANGVTGAATTSSIALANAVGTTMTATGGDGVALAMDAAGCNAVADKRTRVLGNNVATANGIAYDDHDSSGTTTNNTFFAINRVYLSSSTGLRPFVICLGPEEGGGQSYIRTSVNCNLFLRAYSISASSDLGQIIVSTLATTLKPISYQWILLNPIVGSNEIEIQIATDTPSSTDIRHLRAYAYEL